MSANAIRISCACLATCLAMCTSTNDSEIHLIPSGYVGPVVIVFDDLAGSSVQVDQEGARVFNIGSDGILRTLAPSSGSGFHRRRYFYVDEVGQRIEVPYRPDDQNSLQVFGDIVGVTEMLDGKPTGTVRWYSYIVGVPSSAGERMGEQREDTARRAVREAVLARAPTTKSPE